MWDPGQYLRYRDERARPFFDLLSRVRTQDPRYVVDLGCGPGQLTAALAERWPQARVHGLDSDPEMISAAGSLLTGPGAAAGSGRLSFALGDLRDWQPEQQADLIISNAVLQWVPGHERLLAGWTGLLAPGGSLAFQVPGNFDQPSHAVLRELAAAGRWQHWLGGVQLNRQSADPREYADLLARAGCEVDAWETTYLHILPGADPVLDWYKGTGLRPVLAVLPAEQAAEFLAEYGARMRAAYPAAPYGTPFPFRRVFVVARRP
ncbi:MAG: trans-aconitate 2-methyltransferase [Streptosporangiaceae bacterium]